MNRIIQDDKGWTPQAKHQPNDLWRFVAIVACLACIFAALAPEFIRRYRISLRSAAGIYGYFLLMLVLALAPGIRGVREWIRAQIPVWGGSSILIFIWCLPYFIYAIGTGDLRWTALLRLVLVAAPLLLIYRFFPARDSYRFAWQDALVALWLMIVPLSHQLKSIWNLPTNLDFFGRLFLIIIASWSWLFVRRVPDLGYDFSFTAKAFRAAGMNFGLFAAIAVPSSLALGFTAWNPRWRSAGAFCADYIEIFLFIALLEELFFRGFLQTLISNSLRSARGGQAVVSCLFGLFHILHAPFPNWRYVALATVAGWFYGSAFQQSGNLMAPSLVHAMVDTVWRTFLSKS